MSPESDGFCTRSGVHVGSSSAAAERFAVGVDANKALEAAVTMDIHKTSEHKTTFKTRVTIERHEQNMKLTRRTRYRWTPRAGGREPIRNLPAFRPPASLLQRCRGPVDVHRVFVFFVF